jgi:DNA-directed RNA polymerase subunit E'/Rpb7
MFYLSSLTKDICVYPKDLSTDIRHLISSKIRELEGKVIGNHGYIISIVEFNQTSKGKIDNETGRVNFKIMYKAITFKPIVNEIVDTFPIFINEHGFFCKIDSMQIFISQHLMKNWEYNSEKNTWEIDSGSVTKIDSETGSGSEYESETESGSETEPIQCKCISVKQFVRIKIIAVRINSNEITALAEIAENA